MDNFVCGKCGYLAFAQAPETCPVCGAAKEAFKLTRDAIKQPIDPNNLSDLEKKHIPAIKMNKQCGLVGPGCVDAHIKIGDMLHVMEAKHYIMYIDIYLDRAFVARYHLSPEKLNPVLGIHLKVSGGKLLALENCNIHGRWVTEVNID